MVHRVLAVVSVAVGGVRGPAGRLRPHLRGKDGSRLRGSQNPEFEPATDRRTFEFSSIWVPLFQASEKMELTTLWERP